MTDDTDVATGRPRRRSSPWPPLVALGLVAAEVGVALGVVPLAVGGLVVLGGAVVGALDETRHVARPWPLAAGLGLLLAAVGALLVAVQLPRPTLAAVDATLAAPDGVSLRGLAIAVAGAVLIVLGAVGAALDRR